MILLKDTKPRSGQHLVMYFEDGCYAIGTYGKCLTWRGYKMRFRSMGGVTYPPDMIVGWNRIPQWQETLGGTGHMDHSLDPEDITCGWKNTLEDGEMMKEIIFQCPSTHERLIGFTDSEFFAMCRMVHKHFPHKKDSVD